MTLKDDGIAALHVPEEVAAKLRTRAAETRRIDPQATPTQDALAAAEKALDFAAAEYGRHSGPTSTPTEREAFSRDLRVTAMRYARAYHAQAREFGLIPDPTAKKG